MKRVFGTLVLLAGISVTLISCGDRVSNDAVTSLPEIKEAPVFDGTNFDNTAVTEMDLHDKVYLAYFFFTSCAGPCPVMNSKANVLQAEYADAADFRIVGFSVDPENDTVERLARYADRYSAKRGRWYMLRNSESAVVELAARGFLMGDPSQPVLHSTRFALVDKAGMIRGYYDGMDDKAMDKLRSAIDFLLGGGA